MYKIFSGSIVAVVFQNVFYLKIYQNNIFLFLKNYFYYQRIKNDLKIQKKYQFEAEKKIKNF